MIGSVDERGRPLLRLRVQNRDDELLVLVDTGFNGAVLFSEYEATTWGVQILDRQRDIELGDKSRIAVRQGLLQVYWWGTLREVEVEITANPEVSKGAGVHSDGEPSAIAGTLLIVPDILEIDFGRKFLTIRQGTDTNPE
jgi:hypothetical protein